MTGEGYGYIVVPKPAFCRIEYWNQMTVSWETGHAGINLMDPEKYVKKLANRGVIARIIDKDTEQVLYGKGGDLL